MQTVAEARDKNEEALAEAYEEWKEKRKEISMGELRVRPDLAVDRVSEIQINDLGKLSTESHPKPERL